MKRIIPIFLVVILLGCSPKKEGNGRPLIVCTTGMVADAVIQLVDTQARVVSLMGPGVDPHLYKASQGDLEWLYDADMVIYSGLHLEGKMGEVLEKLSRIKPVHAMGSSIDTSLLLNPSGYQGQWDPHIWFDLSLWSKAVDGLSKFLMQQFPDSKNSIVTASNTYRESLLETHDWAKKSIGQIPVEQRVLVTAHDAFGYFGAAYDIEVVGLQGISTASEYGLRDVSEMVQLLSDRRIPSVFIESSIPRRSIEAVVDGCRRKGHDVRIGGTLFSDALGEKNTPESTLIGAFRYNVSTIVEGLKKPSHGNGT